MAEAKKVFFGATGRLGRDFIASNSGFKTPSRNEVNIADAKQTYDYLISIHPDLVIHTAAIVGQDAAEKDREYTYKANVEGTQAIARACRDLDARLVYISTVAVFDGKTGNYNEADIPNPAFYYGWTKLMGEAYVSMTENHVIVRTDFFRPDGFKYPKAYTDHFCSKMPVHELSDAVAFLAKSDFKGIIHVGSPRDTLFNILSKYFPDIEGNTIADSAYPNFPKDLSLDTSLYNKLRPKRN